MAVNPGLTRTVPPAVKPSPPPVSTALVFLGAREIEGR
jgi:hypothetical protein